MDDDQPIIPVMGLHALKYCERLFYLEQVEKIRVADESVFSGRSLHEELHQKEQEKGQWNIEEMMSENLGIIGKVDVLRKRDGKIIPYEHKKGRCYRKNKKAFAWFPDEIQVCAYAMLLEEHTGQQIQEGRVHYHADNVTVKVAVDSKARENVSEAIKRARELSESIQRPPITKNERLCIKCSLAPVCLPEEERLLENKNWDTIRLFPSDREAKIIHVTEPGASIGRSGDALKIKSRLNGEKLLPISEVSTIVLHGYPQMTTQALHFCAWNGIPVHWLSGGGKYLAGLTPQVPSVQRRLRQYQALLDENLRLKLCRSLASAKVETALKYTLRASQNIDRTTSGLSEKFDLIREALKNIPLCDNIDSIRGYEGNSSRIYLSTFTRLINEKVPDNMRFYKRSRRPPRDRFNALLSFGYSLLYQAVLTSIIAVGLDPAIGFFHTPRSSAHPLVMDIMELFRVTLWDIPLIGSLNRLQWNTETDFIETPEKVWLSREGKKKAITLFEKRMEETWKHPVIGYSLSYSRLIELEVRLLEKEWSGKPGLFAKMRLR